jgi:ubiquinone/menaquinone biosynthesis C-methylase UbiE
MKLNWAERWVVNNPLRFIQQQIEIKWLKKMMPLTPGATILEIGCGRGAGAKLILKEFQPSTLYILDLDIRMIQQASVFLSGTPGYQVTMYVGDSIDLPFKTGTMDAVFGFGFLHHVPDWRKALSEVARVLKSNGVYYIEELYPELYQNFITKRLLLHPEHDRFASHDLRNELDKSNLRLRDAFELRKMGILGVAVKSDRTI